jgi:hypothetical protein
MPDPVTIFIFVVALIGFLGKGLISTNSSNNQSTSTEDPKTKNDLINYFEESMKNASEPQKKNLGKIENLEKALSYIKTLPDQVSETKIKRLFDMGSNPKMTDETVSSISGIVQTNDPLEEARIYIEYKTKMFEIEQNNTRSKNKNATIIANLKQAKTNLDQLINNNNDLNKKPLDLDDKTLEEITKELEINFKTENPATIMKKIEAKKSFIDKIKKMFTGNEYVTLEFVVTTKDNKVDSITSLKYKNDTIDLSQANELLLSSDKTTVDEGQNISDTRTAAITKKGANKDPFFGGKSKRNRVKYHKTAKKKISKRY